MKTSFGWSVAVWTMLGCAQSVDSPIGVERAAIVGGELSNDTEDAVVLITVPSTATLCSGTLVAANVVMTALHCVAQYNPFGTFSCDTQGVLITSTPPDGEVGATVEPAEIQIHLGGVPDAVPDAYGSRVFGSGSGVICRNDIALVVLDRSLSAPSVALRVARSTRRGEPMIVVGYGQTENTGSVGRFRRAGVVVADVGSSVTGVTSGSAAPNTFVLGPGACQGDSGGPALSEETGAIVGVYSLSAGISCTSSLIRNVYTQVAPYSALINRAFDAAGTQPNVEPANGGGGIGSGAGAAGTAGFHATKSFGSAGVTASAGGTAAELGGMASASGSPPAVREAGGNGCRVGDASHSQRAIAWIIVLLIATGWCRRTRPTD